MAKKIYHTVSNETKRVYHTRENCSDGKKIEAKDKIVREKCEVCSRTD